MRSRSKVSFVISGTPVDSNGGTVSSHDRNLSLSIPAGAVFSAVNITTESLSQYPFGAVNGTVYLLGPEGTQFAKPVQLTIKYDPSSLPPGTDESGIRIAKLIAGAWHDVSGFTVDTNAKTVTTSITSFSTYGLLPPRIPITDNTVYVADSIPAGSSVYFTELPKAVSYLCVNLPEGEQGTVLIQTNHELAVNSLAFACDIKIEADSGITGRITGPGALPLVIDAAGAINLAGFIVSNAGGVILNANRDIELSGNTFPDDTEIDIGGVSEVPFPAGVAPASVPKLMKGAGDIHSSGTTITKNVFGKNLQLNFNADVKTDAEYNLEENSGPAIKISGNGAIGAGAKMNLLKNAIGILSADIVMKATSQMNVKDHAKLDDLTLRLGASDTPSVNIENNTSASVTLDAKDIASATLNFKITSNNFGAAKFNFDVSNLDIKALQTDWGKITAIVGGTFLASVAVYNWEFTQSNIKGPFSFTADEGGTEKLNYKLIFDKIDLQGDLAISLKGACKFDLNKDTTIKGNAGITVDGNILEFTDTGAKWQAGLKIEGKGVNASLTVKANGGKFAKPLEIFKDPSVDLSVGITDEVFEQLGGIHIYGKRKGSSPRAVHKAFSSHVFQIEIDDLSMDSGTDPNSAIFLTDLDEPVTIKNININSYGWGIHLENINAPVTLKDNTLKGGGIFVNHTQDSVLIENNQIEHTTDNPGASAGIMVGDVKDATINLNPVTISHANFWNGSGIEVNQKTRATVTGNHITRSDNLVALYVWGDSIAYASSNTITGGNVALAKNGLVELKSNTFSSSGYGYPIYLIMDRDVNGGLVNDPWTSNSGIDSKQIFSPVDFDGDGCADYPYLPDPQKDNNNKCITAGVNPPVP